MVIGAIGGLGYYHCIDKMYQNKKDNNNNTNNTWKESVISYIQIYWNRMVGVNDNKDGNGQNMNINISNDKTE